MANITLILFGIAFMNFKQKSRRIGYSDGGNAAFPSINH